jgi:NAD(P)-dependent dehydrogenase (short-subunit alcohol dehydrogenase family)
MTGKTIVITGSSSGFGRCTTLELAKRGWHVFATVRKEADRESLLAEAAEQNCQENLTPLLCDITHEDQVTALVQQVEDQLRTRSGGQETLRLDALLNNAGSAYGGPVELMSMDDIRSQFDLNVFAQMAVTKAFLPLLKAGHATIIYVSSISGRISVPVTGVYSSSKFALEGLSDALRIELAPFGIHVVLIEPASSPTSIWKTSIERSMESLSKHKESGPYMRLLQMAEKSANQASKTGFPMQKFADTVVRILSTPRPRARYGVPAWATAVMTLRRLLPDAIWDRLIRLAMKW